MNELFETGAFVPLIDRVFALDDGAEAVRYYGSRAVKGGIVVTIDGRG